MTSAQQPSILFACPHNILDITSGAALSMRTLLAGLAGRGFRAVALQATIFDSPQGGEHVKQAAQEHKEKTFVRTNVLGVEHLILQTKQVRRGEMTCREQEAFLKRFRLELRDRRPDMIILWGGMLLERTMMAEARRAGVAVVFYLVNGGYKNKDNFDDVDVIVTDTEATAALYRERLGIDPIPCGKFIDLNLIKAPKREAKYITFINPSFEKGVNLFMTLARRAKEEVPDAKFLVVESRGRWPVALKVLGVDPKPYSNVLITSHQKDMRRVYAQARALLVPSNWHESGARVIAEAQLNGIPVLASNRGGNAELVGAGGHVFEHPPEVYENPKVLAPDEVAAPWLDEIRRIVADEAYYDELCAKVEIEARQHDIQNNLSRFLKAVSPAVQRSRARLATVPSGASGAAPSPATPSAPQSQKEIMQRALAAKRARTAAKRRVAR